MIELLIALGAGLISFLSPCVLPLIPGYISYISGSSLNELIAKKNINLVSKIGGIILLLTGILILTNQLQALGYYLLNIFPFLQNFG